MTDPTLQTLEDGHQRLGQQAQQQQEGGEEEEESYNFDDIKWYDGFMEEFLFQTQ